MPWTARHSSPGRRSPRTRVPTTCRCPRRRGPRPRAAGSPCVRSERQRGRRRPATSCSWRGRRSRRWPRRCWPCRRSHRRRARARTSTGSRCDPTVQSPSIPPTPTCWSPGRRPRPTPGDPMPRTHPTTSTLPVPSSVAVCPERAWSNDPAGATCALAGPAANPAQVIARTAAHARQPRSIPMTAAFRRSRPHDRSPCAAGLQDAGSPARSCAGGSLRGPVVAGSGAGRRRRIAELVVTAEPERPWRLRPALRHVLVLGLPAVGREGRQAPDGADALGPRARAGGSRCGTRRCRRVGRR